MQEEAGDPTLPRHLRPCAGLRNPAGRQQPPGIPSTLEERRISGPRSSAQNLRREGGGYRNLAGGGLNLGLARSRDLAFAVWGKPKEIGGKISRGLSELERQEVTTSLPTSFSSLGLPHLLPQIYLLS